MGVALMDARPIGEIVAPIVAEAQRLAKLQWLLAGLPHPADRKTVIMKWWEIGLIADDQASLLIEHNALEAA